MKIEELILESINSLAEIEYPYEIHTELAKIDFRELANEINSRKNEVNGEVLANVINVCKDGKYLGRLLLRTNFFNFEYRKIKEIIFALDSDNRVYLVNYFIDGLAPFDTIKFLFDVFIKILTEDDMIKYIKLRINHQHEPHFNHGILLSFQRLFRYSQKDINKKLLMQKYDNVKQKLSQEIKLPSFMLINTNYSARLMYEIVKLGGTCNEKDHSVFQLLRTTNVTMFIRDKIKIFTLLLQRDYNPFMGCEIDIKRKNILSFIISKLDYEQTGLSMTRRAISRHGFEQLYINEEDHFGFNGDNEEEIRILVDEINLSEHFKSKSNN